MHVHRRILFVTVWMLVAHTARAEGLIYQLPEDKSWARFDCQGAGIGSDGNVRIKVTGTVRISSVGRETIEGQPCRWIELESSYKFRRGDQEAKLTDVIKMLIPEKVLKQGEDPRMHVVKAWRKDFTGTVRELDLNGEGAREIRSLDELLSGPLEETKRLESKVIESELGKLECAGWSGRSVQESGAVLATETYLHQESPFGVVRFHYEKQRGPSGGKRTMTFNLAEHGSDAKTALSENQ